MSTKNRADRWQELYDQARRAGMRPTKADAYANEQLATKLAEQHADDVQLQLFPHDSNSISNYRG